MEHLTYDNCSSNANELLSSILDGSTEYAIIVTDINYKIILWNKGAQYIYGYTSEEMVGRRTTMEIHTKNILDSDILFISKNSITSNFFEREMQAIRKDGSTLAVSVTVTPRVNQSNEIIGYLFIIKDITKIKLQEHYRDVLLEIDYAINSSTSIDELCHNVAGVISKLLDIKVVFICIFDYQNNNFFVNSQVGLQKNYCNHSCSYIPDNEIVPSEMRNCFLTYSQLTINSGKLSEHVISSYIEDASFTHADTSIIHIPLISDISMIGILHIAVPNPKKDFLLSQTQVLSLIANEISAGIQRRRLVEEVKQYADNLEKLVKVRTDQLRQKDAQLVQSGKLATLGEMAAGIAHEINQPLGGISLMAQGLLKAKERGKLDDTLLNEKLNSTIEQVERISKLITHLRTFARQSADLKQEVNVTSPITDTFKLVGQQLKDKYILVELYLDNNLPNVLAEHNKLEQVFLNLINNARDALDEFEEAVNNLRCSACKPAWVDSWCKKITIRTYKEDASIYIEIIDTAGGIPKSILGKIFEPFFTTKEVGKGTGLGLSISYGIIKEFGGTIDVISEEFRGSKFIIKLPAINSI